MCTFVFGLSRSFSLSLVIRFLHGVFDGSLPLAKTILSEISNDKNIAIGTSQFFVGTAIGGCRFLVLLTSRLIGPILCGYLSNKSNIPGLVAKFPILEQVRFSLSIHLSTPSCSPSVSARWRCSSPPSATSSSPSRRSRRRSE